jgi:hypothetical protein
MVLNRKLAWAEKLGLISNDTSKDAERKRKRLLQAAKNVFPIPLTSTNTNSSPESSPFKCGTYLIAHPLMTGFFARTVIILLDHTASSQDNTKRQDEIGPGGTYGLIINRLSLQPITQEKRLEILRQKLEDQERMHETNDGSNSENVAKYSSKLLDIMKPTSPVGSALRRPISLTQAIQPNDLPESVQDAFGGSPLREGGPVNLSLQMLHRSCIDSNDNNIIGGTQIPPIL